MKNFPNQNVLLTEITFDVAYSGLNNLLVHNLKALFNNNKPIKRPDKSPSVVPCNIKVSASDRCSVQKNSFKRFCEEFELIALIEDKPNKAWMATIDLKESSNLNILYNAGLMVKETKSEIIRNENKVSNTSLASELFHENQQLHKNLESDKDDTYLAYIEADHCADGLNIYDQIVHFFVVMLDFQDPANWILTKNKEEIGKNFIVEIKDYQLLTQEHQKIMQLFGVKKGYPFPDCFNALSSNPEKGIFHFDVNPKLEIPQLQTQEQTKPQILFDAESFYQSILQEEPHFQKLELRKQITLYCAKALGIACYNEQYVNKRAMYQTKITVKDGLFAFRVVSVDHLANEKRSILEAFHIGTGFPKFFKWVPFVQERGRRGTSATFTFNIAQEERALTPVTQTNLLEKSQLPVETPPSIPAATDTFKSLLHFLELAYERKKVDPADLSTNDLVEELIKRAGVTVITDEPTACVIMVTKD